MVIFNFNIELTGAIELTTNNNQKNFTCKDHGKNSKS